MLLIYNIKKKKKELLRVHLLCDQNMLDFIQVELKLFSLSPIFIHYHLNMIVNAILQNYDYHP